MRKYIFILLTAFISVSCVDYLDKAPDSGITDKQVFSKLENAKKYFRGVFDARKTGQSGQNYYSVRNGFALNFAFSGLKFSFEQLTDFADPGRNLDSHKWKRGEMMATINYLTYSTGQKPIFGSMFEVIRICNRTLENLDKIVDASEEDIEDLRAQAYFIRGFAHFTLIKLWGPMPYITSSIGPDDDWDLPRLSIYESYQGVVKDMDLAYASFEKAGKIRRDPKPGEAGHLNDPEQDLPNGVAAKALKARALLYSASPLNNTMGEDEWKVAADAAWDALKTALDNGYTLMPFDKYTDNFYGVSSYCNEHLWAWDAGTFKYNDGNLQGLLSGIFANKVSYQSGECPTQNLVDKFETANGYPLDTEEAREIAKQEDGYNEQNPYVNRDPRLAKSVIYNQADIIWPSVTGQNVQNKANLFYYVGADGKTTYSDLLNPNYDGRSRTGYMQRKYTGDLSYQNNKTIHLVDPIFRLAELYLIYAEAVNEAYGPGGKAPNADITALQAVNEIRRRANMPPVLSKFTSNPDLFRERIKNERAVELCMEGGHRFTDLRRWKDAPAVLSQPVYGIDVKKVEVSAEYPTGYQYTRIALPSDRQTKWYDFMYYLPFNLQDYYRLSVFDTSLNPKWY